MTNSTDVSAPQNDASENDAAENDTPKTLDATERRVLGVLIEKAKTTPDAYPLSLNALRNGSNQKSNRFPQMSLEEEQIDRAADTLRQKKGVSLVQGDSRVERYRHLGYDWFGVDKTELAVMAELMLRGAQTVGELRGRAARMEPIKGMGELTPILASLVQKGHVTYLSPPGRGAIVSHTFYSAKEMDRVRRDLGLGAFDNSSTIPSSPAAPSEVRPSAATPAEAPSTFQEAPTNEAPSPMATASNPTTVATNPTIDWQAELTAMRAELTQEISDLRSEFEAFKERVEG